MVADLLRQFNSLRDERRSLIAKALDSSTGSGGALIPQHLEDTITNAVVRLSPEIAMINPKFDSQKYHEFNRLTALPASGGAMGENATTPTYSSTYVRDGVNLRIIRRKGAVTNFLKDTSAKYVDAAASEMENHLLAHAYDIIHYCINGNNDANTYEPSGIEHFIATTRVNNAQGGVVPTDLSFLDDMIDEYIIRQGQNHKKALLMSPKMLSKVSKLLTNVRLNQGMNGLGTVEINGGWRLNAYRDIPIIPTAVLRPTSTMTAVSLSEGAGTIAAAAWYFRVAPVTVLGEQLASAEATITTSGGSSSIALTWTAFSGAIKYRIYAGSASGATFLVREISAFTYDGNGTITGVVTGTTFTSTPTTPNGTVTAAKALDRPLVATGGVAPESVILWDLDDFQGMGKFAYTNQGGSKFNGLVTVDPLAITDDNVPFMIKTYGALVPAFEATSAITRNLRVA